MELLEKSQDNYQNENSDFTDKERLLKNKIKDFEIYVSHIESDNTSIKEELKNTTYKVSHYL